MECSTGQCENVTKGQLDVSNQPKNGEILIDIPRNIKALEAMNYKVDTSQRLNPGYVAYLKKMKNYNVSLNALTKDGITTEYNVMEGGETIAHYVMDSETSEPRKADTIPLDLLVLLALIM